MVQLHMEAVYLTKLYVHLPFQQAILLLGIYLEHTYTFSNTQNAYTQVNYCNIICNCKILETISKCANVEKQVNKLWYVHTVGFCAAVQKNEELVGITLAQMKPRS